jgi:DNA-binding NarL/FixJ family response regulator
MWGLADLPQRGIPKSTARSGTSSAGRGPFDRKQATALINAEPDLDVTAQAASVSTGQVLVANGEVDVLVVDVGLPDGDGLWLARAARAADPALGIVVLTMFDDDDTLLGAPDAGASALVLKSSEAPDVLSAIRRAAHAPDTFSATGLGAALRRRDLAMIARPILTAREVQVLERIVDGESAIDVARALYMSPSTVKTHLARLYNKLGAHNRATAVMAAIRLGVVKPHDRTPA